MRKTRLLIALAIVVAAMLVSCKKDPVVVEKGAKITFSATSSSETLLAPGYKLGLFVGEPVNENNVLLTVAEDGGIQAEKELRWGDGQKSASSFLAYGPYDSTYTAGGTVTFSVKEDQSDSVSLAASDLLVSLTSATPLDDKVSFKLAHKMAQIIIVLDNRTGKTVTGVELKNIKKSASVNLTNGNVEASGETAKIKTVSTDKGYVALVPPQTALLKIDVTFADGSVVENEIDKETKFESGSSYSTSTNPVILNDPNIKVSFSVSDWVDGGQLNFNGGQVPPAGDYTKLSDISSTATSKGVSFSESINATVTYVIGNYAHIEDESGAICIFCNGHGLEAGQQVTGTVSGTIKLYNNLPQITSINLSSAKITTASSIPCTTLTISELKANYDRYLSCRIKLEDVTVDKGISPGSTSSKTGQISQNSSTIAIFASYSTAPAQIEAGLTGNLICFPICYNTTKELAIYESSQFEEGGTSGEENAFTAKTEIGVYNLTDAENPVVIAKAGSYDQISAVTLSSSRKFAIINLAGGSAIFAEISAKSLAAGNNVNLTVSTLGTSFSGVTAGTFSVSVSKKSGKTVWLSDSTNKTGYIISIE